MTEPINDPLYWKQRLATAVERHHSIFRCDKERWLRIEAKHREILAKVVHPEWSVLDAGCGYGRLLTLIPKNWRGWYQGVDISPDFVQLARTEWPRHDWHQFQVGDLRSLSFIDRSFDVAVLISIRPMVRRNLGEEEWDKMERELKRVAKRLLYLEYDENDPGELVESGVFQ